MARIKKDSGTRDTIKTVSAKISKTSKKLKVNKKLLKNVGGDIKSEEVSREVPKDMKRKVKTSISSSTRRKRVRNNEFNMKKKAKKRNSAEGSKDVDNGPEVPQLTRFSDDPLPKKNRWINRQRVLVFGCRGISVRDRHLMKDLRSLLPHSRPESKMERRENLAVVNEMCAMKNCNKCVMLEGRLKRDIYLWVSDVPNGPSAKFLLENVYTMEELHFTGNCLVGSRPLLSFDSKFDSAPHYRIMKELFIQVFGTPNHHPKSQPFIDHVLTFSILDNRIWFRNYQILSEDGALVEIGPRFAMNPVKIFKGSFGGETLWQNPLYVTPAKYRQEYKRALGGRYMNRIQQKASYDEKKKKMGKTYKLPESDEIFTDDLWEKAKEIVSKATDDSLESKNKNSKKLKKKKGKKPKIV